MFKEDLLKGKRILVTGGGTGLGKEIAAKYLALGAELWIAGRRGGVLEDTAKELMAKHGGSVRSHAVDIRDAAAVDAMVQKIWDEGGPLTGLVNNAPATSSARPRTSRRTASTPSPTSCSTARSTSRTPWASAGSPAATKAACSRSWSPGCIPARPMSCPRRCPRPDCT